MRARAFPCAVFLALAAMIPIVAARASFVEEVLIERLRDDAVALVFTFTTTEHELERHSAVMAKPLRAVLAKSRDVLRVSERAGDVYGGDVTGVGI